MQHISALRAAAESEGGFWEDAYPIIPHPAELIFGFIAFAIIYWVVAKKIAPRLELIFAERTAAIEGGIAKAEQAQAEASAALEEYREQLAEGRAEAARIREQATEQGALIIAEMRERAQEEAARITAAAQAQIQAERQHAIVELRSEIGRLSTELASRIVGEALDDEVRQSRVVDRFLAELESEPAVSSGSASSGTRDGQT